MSAADGQRRLGGVQPGDRFCPFEIVPVDVKAWMFQKAVWFCGGKYRRFDPACQLKFGNAAGLSPLDVRCGFVFRNRRESSSGNEGSQGQTDGRADTGDDKHLVEGGLCQTDHHAIHALQKDAARDDHVEGQLADEKR